MTLLNSISKFRYSDINSHPFPMCLFSKQYLTDIRVLTSVLLNDISNPIDPPSLDELLTINNILKKKFDCNTSQNALQNITTFATTLNRLFLNLDKEFFSERIYSYLLDKHDAGLARECCLNLDFNFTIEKLANFAQSRVSNLGLRTKRLSKQDIFEVFYLRLVTLYLWRYNVNKTGKNTSVKIYEVFHQDHYNNYKVGFNRLDSWMAFGAKKKHEFKDWSYDHIAHAVRIVNDCVMHLHKIHGGKQIVFIARDGLIFYESYLAHFPSEASRLKIAYVSRATLNVKNAYSHEDAQLTGHVPGVFDFVKKYLLEPSLQRVGIRNVSALVDDLQYEISKFTQSNTSRGQIAKLLNQVIAELDSYLRDVITGDAVVFFDSSSKSLPVLLSAFAETQFPNKKFYPYFCVTEYNDPTAGFIINSKENYVTDLLAEEVQFNLSKSTLIPYDPQLKPSEPETAAKHFLVRLIMYREM